MANRESRFKPDWHHAWHDRLNPRLQGVGGVALRVSRVQLTNYDAHHLDYHGWNFIGPYLPVTDEQRLRPVVMAAAGYIPEYAIAFDRESTPKIVPLSAHTRQNLWKRHAIKVEKPGDVRDFLAAYILRQDYNSFSGSVIDEFLNTKNERKRCELGNMILSYGLRQAVNPFSLDYKRAYKSELLPPTQNSNVGRFVLKTITHRHFRDKVYDRLRAQLVA